jgi:hypothetical protein
MKYLLRLSFLLLVLASCSSPATSTGESALALQEPKIDLTQEAAMAKHSQRLKDSLLHAYRYHELRTSGYPYLPS